MGNWGCHVCVRHPLLCRSFSKHGAFTQCVLESFIPASTDPLHLRPPQVVNVYPVCIGVPDTVAMGSTLNETIAAVSATTVPSFITGTLYVLQTQPLMSEECILTQHQTSLHESQPYNAPASRIQSIRHILFRAKPHTQARCRPLSGLHSLLPSVSSYVASITFCYGIKLTKLLSLHFWWRLRQNSSHHFTRIFVIGLFNALLVTLAPTDLVQAGVGFGIALPSIASSRILLDLREVDRKRQEQTDVRGLSVDQWETIFHVP